MIFKETSLKGSYVVELDFFSDNRGWFVRTYCNEEFSKIGYNKNWVQINHSFTQKKGTVRGLHFQKQPFSETKLIRCVSGIIFDVIVDIRPNSPTFLNWFGIELSSENKKMLFVPEGFAHGFQTLTDDVEIIYHHSQHYAPGYESGLRYDDPRLNINWKLDVSNISPKDESHIFINDDFNIFLFQ